MNTETLATAQVILLIATMLALGVAAALAATVSLPAAAVAGVVSLAASTAHIAITVRALRG